MTLAPRADVFIELACEELWISRHHHSRHQHTHAHKEFSTTPSPIRSYVDGSVPLILNHSSLVPISSVELLHLPSSSTTGDDLPMDDETPINCLAEPSVQAGAAKLQASA